MAERWTARSLGEIANVVSDRATPAAAEGSMFVGLEHLASNSRSLSRWGDVSEVSSRVTPFRPGDTLFGRLRPYLKKGCVAPTAGLCSTEILVVRPGSNVLDAFLGLLLLNDEVFAECDRLSAGSRMPRVSAKDLMALRLLIPPMEEQRRIVDLIGSIDTYIDSLEGQIDATRTAQKAVAEALLESIVGAPSQSLAELEDGGLIQLGRGDVISKKDMAARPGDFPVYSSAAKNNGMIGSYGEYMFDEELITWSIDGGGHLFHRPRHKFSVTNIGGYLRILDRNRLSYGFLCAALQRLHSRCHFDWQHKAHPSVLRYEYSAIPVPTMSRQHEIESAIASVDAQGRELELQVAAGRALRSAILSELLSGERLLDDSYDMAVGL